MKKPKLFLIFLLCLYLISGVTEAQIEKIDIANLKLLDAQLSNKISGLQPGLSIAITVENEVVFEKYYGYADLSKQEKLNLKDVMGIASMSKQFTGMAALFLVEEGKLDVDNYIDEYLPQLPLEGRKIKVRQLLSHTSGLPEITQNEVFMNSIGEKHFVQEIINMAFQGDFRSEPGVKWQYCNTGYTIVVELIEKLSGQNFSDFLQTKIFKPLKMTNTYCPDYEQDAENTVPRYLTDSAGFKPARTMHFSNLIGGGGIISNVDDMAKWGIALCSGNQLPKNYAQIWKTNYLNSGEETWYGFGMGQNEYKGKSYYYHPGMGDGMNAVNFIFPDDKISITVIRNVSEPEVTSVAMAELAMDYLFFDIQD